MRWSPALPIAFCLVLLWGACGGEQEPPPPAVPPRAQVAAGQITEAERLGVPVEFENSIGMRFVLIPGGRFLMGPLVLEEHRYDHAGPQHEVAVSPFYLAVTEVTNAQYRRFRPEHFSGEASGASLDGADQPVVMVSHMDATAFLRWLSNREDGAAYRLPSEAEWEYACRAGTTTRFWSGDDEEDLERVGWYFRNAGVRLLPRDTAWDFDKVRGEWACRSHPVGEKAPNPWGLYDVHGNVWEWCEDTWNGSYEGAPADGSAWVEGGVGARIYRGGYWGTSAGFARSTYRGWAYPWLERDFLGLRPARAVLDREE